MNGKFLRLLSLVASVPLAACGESTDVVLGELSQAEVEDLAGAVVLATFDGTGALPTQPQQSAGGPQAVAISFSHEMSREVACPLGGVVAVTASLDVEGDTETGVGHVDYSMTQVHEACVVRSERERTFTLDGAPAMTLAFSVDRNGQGTVEWHGTMRGAIDWVTGERAGTCSVDLEFGGRREGDAAIAAELAGTVCGRLVARTLTIG